MINLKQKIMQWKTIVKKLEKFTAATFHIPDGDSNANAG